jgi:nucleoside-diphosphate-sugar epimerase
MNIVLTGASGFLGRPCCERLTASGHTVLALSRQHAPSDLPVGVVWLVRDLANVDSYRTDLESFNPDAAIHLAWDGIPDFSLGKCLHNLETGALFAESVLQAGARHLVVSGSCWEYGKVSGPLSEQKHLVSPSVFAAAKNAQRLLLKALTDATNATLAWGRVFFVYGPRQRAASLAPTICKTILAGNDPSLKTPSALNDFVYVEDVAEALVLLAETKSNGVFNIGSGVPTAAGQVADQLLSLVGRPPQYAQQLSKEESGSGFYADITALRGLGWEPRTSLREGLQKTLAYFQSE